MLLGLVLYCLAAACKGKAVLIHELNVIETEFEVDVLNGACELAPATANASARVTTKRNVERIFPHSERTFEAVAGTLPERARYVVMPLRSPDPGARRSPSSTRLDRQGRAPICSESRSAIMIVGMCVNPDGTVGIIDASTTKRCSVP